MFQKRKTFGEVYDNYREQYHELFQAFLEHGDFARKKVIDLGCGTGRYTRMFAQCECAELIGLDKWPSMLGRAKNADSDFAAPKPATYVKGFIELLDKKYAAGSFDTIIMSQVLHWIYSKKLALDQIFRLLAPDGTFLLNTLSHKQLGKLILMKHFPEILQIEETRFPSIPETEALLASADFVVKVVQPVDAPRSRSIESLVAFAREKATSALRIYAEEVGDEYFDSKVDDYERLLRREYTHGGDIREAHAYTLLVAKKKETNFF